MRIPFRHRKGAHKDFILIFATLVASVLPFLLAPARAQILGPTGRGEFAYFQSAISIIYAVSALGARHAVYRYHDVGSSRFETSKRPLFAVSLVASTVTGVLLALLAGNEISWWIAVLIFAMGLFGPVYALTQLEIGNAQLGRYRKRIATLAGGPAIVEFVVGLVLLLVRQFHLATVVAATVLAEMVRNGSALFWYLRDRGRFEGNSISGPKSGTQFLQSSLIAAPAVLVPILASNLDSIIYGSMLGPSTLGMYAVAKLGFTVLVLASITAEGYVVAQWAHRRPIQVFARFVLIGLPSSVVVAVVGYLLFPYFFGSAFQEARLAFPLAVLAGLFGSIFVCFLSIAAFNDRHRAALNAASISVVALGVGAILISVLGRPSASDMCLVLLAAQIVGVLLITFRMSPAISISPTTTRISR